MEQISTIGLDIAKNVFQVHGIDGSTWPSSALSPVSDAMVLRNCWS